MFRNPFWQRLAIVFLLIAVSVLGVMAVAAATADRFYASRIVAWRNADFRDFERFPSRRVSAGPETFFFEPAPEEPPEYLRTVTYRSDAPEPKTPRESMANPLDSAGGTEVTEPLDKFLEDTDTTAFLVIRDDALLYEGYFNGYDRKSTQTLLGSKILRVGARRHRHRGGLHRERRRSNFRVHPRVARPGDGRDNHTAPADDVLRA